jgi:hypothetical protein
MESIKKTNSWGAITGRPLLCRRVGYPVMERFRWDLENENKNLLIVRQPVFL